MSLCIYIVASAPKLEKNINLDYKVFLGGQHRLFLVLAVLVFIVKGVDPKVLY